MCVCLVSDDSATAILKLDLFPYPDILMHISRGGVPAY